MHKKHRLTNNLLVDVYVIRVIHLCDDNVKSKHFQANFITSRRSLND